MSLKVLLPVVAIVASGAGRRPSKSTTCLVGESSGVALNRNRCHVGTAL